MISKATDVTTEIESCNWLEMQLTRNATDLTNWGMQPSHPEHTLLEHSELHTLLELHDNLTQWSVMQLTWPQELSNATDLNATDLTLTPWTHPAWTSHPVWGSHLSWAQKTTGDLGAEGPTYRPYIACGDGCGNIHKWTHDAQACKRL